MQTIHGTWRTDPDAVTLIDAHHHLWDLSRNHYPWLSDEPETHGFLGNYDSIKRDYLPDDLRRDAARHNVLATVHIEAEMNRAHQLTETRWLEEINRLHGVPTVIVAHAWFHTENAEEIVAGHAACPLVRGIRSKPVTARTPDEALPRGAGSMHDPAWLRGFSLLEKYDLSWDLRVPFWHLAEAAEVARSFPRTRIVLNHTGFPWDRSPEGLAAWRAGMHTLARCENVHLKVSEFGLKDQPWNYESNRGVVLDAIDIFGVERCIFASNFPVASVRIGYHDLVTSVARMIAHLPQAQRDAFFWRNAKAFYRIH